MTRSREAWILFLSVRAVGLVIDTLIVGVSYIGALLLRFDFAEPRWGWRKTAMAFVSVAAVHLISLVVCGTYSRSWRKVRFSDFWRYLAATALACVILTAMRFWMPDMAMAHIRPPYSVTLISFVLATLGLIASRLAWHGLWALSVDEKDLLARPEKQMDASVAAAFLRGKTVMVTGAGGSIGSELVRQVVRAGAKTVLMVERGENALYQIDREVNWHLPGDADPEATRCLPLMIDINERAKMEAVFVEHHPDVVLHAAAYKHVPMVEMNPEEGWRNNAEATKLVAELARDHGVSRFVLISTDKAVNPVSVMGKSKLAAERAIMALNGVGREGKASTSFCAVRFGNVMGSSGSVVPLFREQIAKVGFVTVTHVDMKRYFMTVEEAVGLVLQAASRKEAAVYTLDMGEPVRIVDLAEGMIRQAGYRPYVDIPIVFTGIRPGEKLFEELDVSEKSCYKTDMAKIYITKGDAAGEIS